MKLNEIIRGNSVELRLGDQSEGAERAEGAEGVPPGSLLLPAANYLNPRASLFFAFLFFFPTSTHSPAPLVELFSSLLRRRRRPSRRRRRRPPQRTHLPSPSSELHTSYP